MCGKDTLLKELEKLVQDQDIAFKICSTVEKWINEEQEHKRECQKMGIKKARENGVSFGRPRIKEPDNFEKICLQYMEGQLTAAAAARLCGMGVSTFYRRVSGKYEK